jgi:hypothetical protein
MHAGLKSCLSELFNELGVAVAVSNAKFGQEIFLWPSENLAMLSRDIALMNFTLTLGRQKGWIGQDEPSQFVRAPTRD